MTNFLPKGYKTPETPSRYMSFEEGKNIIRVLSSAIVGWEWWTEDKEGNRKPNRVRAYVEIPDQIKNHSDNRQRGKHFWAFVVYNFETKQIQILELIQKTIMRSIETLVQDKENWGDPKEYNLVIMKQKTGSRDMDVEYSVMPQPKKEIDREIIENYKAMEINLEALYEGADPFRQDSEELAEEAAKEVK